MVYSSVPSSVIRSSLFGMVMLWATDFLPLWKKVSGVQILLAMRLFRRSTAMGPLNFNLSSFQLCLKKTSIVYSCGRRKARNKYTIAGSCYPSSLLFTSLNFPQCLLMCEQLTAIWWVVSCLQKYPLCQCGNCFIFQMLMQELPFLLSFCSHNCNVCELQLGDYSLFSLSILDYQLWAELLFFFLASPG